MAPRAGGRAAQACAQTVIADVNTDAGFAPHRDIAAAPGFRAVQSTPLTDYAGRLIGIVSTDFTRPYRPPPPAPDLRVTELYGDLAGEAVARRLGVPTGDGLSDLAGRAPAEEMMARFAQSPFAADIVSRLFSAGLSLETARGIAGTAPPETM